MSQERPRLSEPALAGDTETVGVIIRRAEALRLSGESAAARRLLHAARSQGMSDPELLARVARGFWLLGDFGTAADVFGALADASPGYTDLRFNAALAAARAGSVMEARSHLEQLLNEDAEDVDALALYESLSVTGSGTANGSPRSLSPLAARTAVPVCPGVQRLLATPGGRSPGARIPGVGRVVPGALGGGLMGLELHVPGKIHRTAPGLMFAATEESALTSMDDEDDFWTVEPGITVWGGEPVHFFGLELDRHPVFVLSDRLLGFAGVQATGSAELVLRGQPVRVTRLDGRGVVLLDIRAERMRALEVQEAQTVLLSPSLLVGWHGAVFPAGRESQLRPEVAFEGQGHLLVDPAAPRTG